MQNGLRGVSSSVLQKNEVRKVKIRPHEQVKVLLGDFAKDEIPKGFCVEVAGEEHDSVSSEVIAVEAKGKIRFFAHVINYSAVPGSVNILRQPG